MKVVSMLGGLGSQMFKYAFYLQVKGSDESYIDTTPFRLLEMWNGYELERIFGIREKDISEQLTDEEIDIYKNENISYKKVAEITIEKMKPHKPVVSIFRGYWYPNSKHRILLFVSLIYNKLKRLTKKNNEEKDTYPILYKTKCFSIYYDEFNHTSDRYFGGEKNRKKLSEVFAFPAFSNERNIQSAGEMQEQESVAIHVRRSDHMYDNCRLFEDDYFKKSVSYIKERVKNPVFYVFSDEPEWCRSSLNILGLNDCDVRFVDWNVGTQSFRDMQLMTYCKHNILAISSFSWWGYYLSKRDDKIVCAPKGYWLEVPVHF